MTESEMDPSIITKGRYKYVHIRPPEAIDVHHIIVARRGAGGLLFCTYSLLFIFICFLIHLLLQDVTIVFRLLMPDQPVAIVFWSFALAAFLLRQFLRKQVEKESVIVFPAFGVQLETVYQSGRTLRQFVPLSNILKPVLNECVTPVTCYWSLSLILRGEEQLLLVFKGLYPPVTMLVPIWKALCAAIDDEDCIDVHQIATPDVYLIKSRRTVRRRFRLPETPCEELGAQCGDLVVASRLSDWTGKAEDGRLPFIQSKCLH